MTRVRSCTHGLLHTAGLFRILWYHLIKAFTVTGEDLTLHVH